MTSLFTPFALRSVTLRNRVGMSPMCMYSSANGFVQDWHLVHYPTRAVGGVGLVIVEASAVEARGVISPSDLGIWSDDHVEGLTRLAALIEKSGAAPAIQLAHAGRKSGSFIDPATGESKQDVIAPSAIAFDAKQHAPREMAESDLNEVKQSFVNAARRAVAAGFRVTELHMAHGYLLHSFLSPIANRRLDRFGGDFANRVRFPLDVIDAVRGVIPEAMPLLVRISATDVEPEGWSIEQSIEFARIAKRHGVDLFDCSSGGITSRGWFRKGPGYQVKYAERVRAEAQIATAAVGEITDAKQAQRIIAEGQADLVLLARELLRNPYWALEAMRTLSPEKYQWPVQYRSGVPIE